MHAAIYTMHGDIASTESSACSQPSGVWFLLFLQTDQSSVMNSTLAEHGPLICELQMQRAQQDIERNMLATMQSGLGAVRTDEMRSKQVRSFITMYASTHTVCSV